MSALDRHGFLVWYVFLVHAARRCSEDVAILRLFPPKHNERKKPRHPVCHSAAEQSGQAAERAAGLALTSSRWCHIITAPGH